MHNLNFDIFSYCILNHINSDDTFNMSLVCRTWHNNMNQMFNTHNYYKNFDFIPNDSYALSKYLTIFDIDKTLNKIHIPTITNSTCLNIITYYWCIQNKCKYNNIMFELLTQHCILNNISKPSYIKLLIDSLCIIHNHNDLLNDMMDICLCIGSYDMADFLFLCGSSSDRWLHSIPVDCTNKNSYIKIIESLKYLIKNHLISLPYFYTYLNNVNDFPYRNNILNFISQYLNDNILKLSNHISS